MVASVAALADIHGVLPVPDAVLAEPDVVAVDLNDAVASVVRGSDYPGRQAWAEEYVRSANSDADAIRAFGPRDGRGVPLA